MRKLMRILCWFKGHQMLEHWEYFDHCKDAVHTEDICARCGYLSPLFSGNIHKSWRDAYKDMPVEFKDLY